ncbi:MAG TPA: META domain-containing protein [Anaerolineae bacterium]|nr:META domain-containing protein [Anaerolineae bacterium]
MQNKKYHAVVKVDKLFLSLAVVALLLALTWTFGRLVEPARASAFQQGLVCDEVYTVQQGDWLSKIAEKYYGNPLAYDQLVVAANTETGDAYTDIGDPNLIEPGWVLCITSVDIVAALADLAAQAPAGLSPQELANATYKSQYTISPTITLQNGQYSEPAAPGSATETTIKMTRNLAYGDMNGQPSAAVILVTNPGGSGTFYDLHLMFAPQGVAVNPATAFLGDRVQINDLKIENSLIVVDMVQAGPNDPLCCPSQHVIKSFSWEKDNLVEASSEVVEDSAASGQAGGEGTGINVPALHQTWQWEKQRDPNSGSETVISNPANYTLTLNPDATYQFQADCNQGSGSYTADETGAIRFQPGPVTLAECGPDSRYQDMLNMMQAVQNYRLEENGLVLVLIWPAAGPMDYYRVQ